MKMRDQFIQFSDEGPLPNMVEARWVDDGDRINIPVQPSGKPEEIQTHTVTHCGVVRLPVAGETRIVLYLDNGFTYLVEPSALIDLVA